MIALPGGTPWLVPPGNAYLDERSDCRLAGVRRDSLLTGLCTAWWKNHLAKAAGTAPLRRRRRDQLAFARHSWGHTIRQRPGRRPLANRLAKLRGVGPPPYRRAARSMWGKRRLRLGRRPGPPSGRSRPGHGRTQFGANWALR